LAIAACLSAALANADEISSAAPPTKVVTRCQACHGPRGNSTSGTVPRLNGQQADYIAQRLNEFLDPTREDPHATATMGMVISEVDNATFAAIAAYYAGQSPNQPVSTGVRATEGMRIYMNGVSDGTIPACQACHGARAEGHGAIPRLAGQHAEYLTAQLQRLRLGIRETQTMYHNIKAMTDDQIEDIVAYLASD
jgi:cytochrome c553